MVLDVVLDLVVPCLQREGSGILLDLLGYFLS